MGIQIEIAKTKIIIYDTRNSIAYHRFMAKEYRDFYRFSKELQNYMLYQPHLTFADIITIARENDLVAISHRTTV